MSIDSENGDVLAARSTANLQINENSSLGLYWFSWHYRNTPGSVVEPQNKTFEPGNSISYKITCAPNKNSGQPAHPRGLIGVFAVRGKTIWMPEGVLQRLFKNTDAQDDLSLSGAHMQTWRKCCVPAHLIVWKCLTFVEVHTSIHNQISHNQKSHSILKFNWSMAEWFWI